MKQVKFLILVVLLCVLSSCAFNVSKVKRGNEIKSIVTIYKTDELQERYFYEINNLTRSYTNQGLCDDYCLNDLINRITYYENALELCIIFYENEKGADSTVTMEFEK